MNVIYGPCLAQADGNADDGDPATPPKSFSGPPPQSAVDAATTASSTPLGKSALNLHDLQASSCAIPGPNPKKKAIANTKDAATTSFTVTYSFLNKLMQALGWPGPTFNLSTRLTFTVQAFKSAKASLVLGAWVRAAKGGTLMQIQHHYDFTDSKSVPGSVDVTRDGKITVPLGLGVPMPDSDITSARLPEGSYIFQSELNVIAQADTRADLRGSLEVFLNY
jgi:hypothetical protein